VHQCINISLRRLVLDRAVANQQVLADFYSEPHHNLLNTGFFVLINNRCLELLLTSVLLGLSNCPKSLPVRARVHISSKRLPPHYMAATRNAHYHDADTSPAWLEIFLGRSCQAMSSSELPTIRLHCAYVYRMYTSYRQHHWSRIAIGLDHDVRAADILGDSWLDWKGSVRTRPI
jgi:hypothetical protein